MIAASRYAKSLLDLAVEKKQLDVVYKDMLVIKSTIESSHDLRVFLKNPVARVDKKISVLKALFLKNVGTLTNAYLELVANKKRANILFEISIEFVEQYRKFNGITSAVITSAVKLDAESRKKALEILKGFSKGEVELTEKINPLLIGGFVLTVGDKQIDNSVSRQLLNLKKNFNTKSVSIN